MGRSECRSGNLYRGIRDQEFLIDKSQIFMWPIAGVGLARQLAAHLDDPGRGANRQYLQFRSLMKTASHHLVCRWDGSAPGCFTHSNVADLDAGEVGF